MNTKSDSIISVKNLQKNYTVFQKEPGTWGSIKSLVNRKYETVHAVKGISFSIEAGELVGFIGPNGAGKTTTLKCLSGLLHPTEGTIKVLGFTPYKRESKYLKSISLIMGQKNQLWWDLPAMETFILNKEIYGVSDSNFKQILGELSELLDVKDILKTPVRKLSLGQRMKMELIAALIHTPKVLFLDEPTIGLDVIMQKNLREFIREYNKRYNATVILTSHYMNDVEELCKRVIVINHGTLLYDGSLSDLVKKHAPHKIIRVILDEKIDREKIKKVGEIKSYSFPELVLRVSQKDLKTTSAKILQTLPVNDLTIEDPDLEEIIREVFAQK